MAKTVRIPSRLYHKLYSNGKVDGDRLIAVFCMLKAGRDGEKRYMAHKSANGKFVGGYSLLRKQTNLSIATLQKYVPILEQEGLVTFHKNGNVHILGNNKTKASFNMKLVPIPVGKNLVFTARAVLFVRVYTCAKNQRKEIDRKRIQRELLTQGLTNPSNINEYRKAKKAFEKLGTTEIEITEDVILSNRGYARLKGGLNDSTSRGSYWKSVLLAMKCISSNRRLERISQMSYLEYLTIRKETPELTPNLRYVNGWMCLEQAASLEVLGLPEDFGDEIKIEIIYINGKKRARVTYQGNEVIVKVKGNKVNSKVMYIIKLPKNKFDKYIQNLMDCYPEYIEEHNALPITPNPFPYWNYPRNNKTNFKKLTPPVNYLYTN